MLSARTTASCSASTRMLASLGQRRSYGPLHRASMQVPGSLTNTVWTRQQVHHHRPGVACLARPGKGEWSPVIKEAVRGLNTQDPAAQVEGAVQLWRIAKSASAYKQHEAELIPSGAAQALYDAVLSSNLEVRSNAIVSLSALAVCKLEMAASLPASKHVPVCVELLQQLEGMTDEDWSRQVGGFDRKLVQGSAAVILSLVVAFQSPELIPVEAVPYLVNLLDEDSKDNIVRVSAPMALMVLVSPKAMGMGMGMALGMDMGVDMRTIMGEGTGMSTGTPTPKRLALQEAVLKSQAIDKIGSWLSSNQSHLVMVAAQFLGFIAASGEEGKRVLEERGVFDKLVREFMDACDTREATGQALALWGKERLAKEIPKYSGFWPGEDRG